MFRTEIVISVRDGILQDVFCSDTDADVILVDWDGQPHDEGIVEVPRDDRILHALVNRPNPQPLRLLAGSDVEAAIEAAGQAGVLPQPTY